MHVAQKPLVVAVSSPELTDAVPALSNLLIETVASGASMGFLPPLSLEQARTYWLSLRGELQSGSRLLLVARHNDRIIGAGQLALPRWPNARHRAELEKLMVSSTVRGRGIGRMLVGALHQAARDRGRTLVLLGARRGSPAEQFYRTLGYREIGVIPGFAIGTSGERYDLISFYRDLSEPTEEEIPRFAHVDAKPESF